MQTANFDAAYGRSAGGNVDLVSRSGSNHFHGSAWEFVRNNIFNANDFSLKLNGQPRADLKHNQFDGSFGGPLWRNKTFFFVAYQGLTEVNGLGDETQSTLQLPLCGNAGGAVLPGGTSRFSGTAGDRVSYAGSRSAGGLRWIEYQSCGPGGFEC